MRLFLFGILAALAGAVTLGWIAIVTGAFPVNADSAPPPLERWAARTAVIAGVERRVTRTKNPVRGTNALLDGIAVY